MNKNYLIQKIAAIHAVKCWKAQNFDVATDSFSELSRLSISVIKGQEKEADEIEARMQLWQNSLPGVSESEVHAIMKK